MSTPATPTAEGSAPAPTAPEVNAPGKVSLSDVLDPSEIAAIESADKGTLAPAVAKNDYQPATTLEPAATPAAPAAPAAPKPDTPETPPVPEADLDPAPEKLGKFRVSARDFKEAEFLRLSKSMPVTEAYAKVYGNTAKPAEPTTPATTETPATPAKPAEADPAAALRDEIARLEAESDKAAEDLDTKQANRLNRQIVAKEAELRALEASKKATEQSKATEADTIFRQKETEAAKEVYAARPELANPASAEHKEFTDFYRLKATDPDYATIFESPRWPAIMYREFAEAKGWGKAVAPASAPALPAPTPGATAAPRATAATVLTPGESSGGPTDLSPAQIMEAIDAMDVTSLRALLPAGRR